MFCQIGCRRKPRKHTFCSKRSSLHIQSIQFEYSRRATNLQGNKYTRPHYCHAVGMLKWIQCHHWNCIHCHFTVRCIFRYFSFWYIQSCGDHYGLDLEIRIRIHIEIWTGSRKIFGKHVFKRNASMSKCPNQTRHMWEKVCKWWIFQGYYASVQNGLFIRMCWTDKQNDLLENKIYFFAESKHKKAKRCPFRTSKQIVYTCLF